MPREIQIRAPVGDTDRIGLDNTVDAQRVRRQIQRTGAVDIADGHPSAIDVPEANRVAADDVDCALQVVIGIVQGDHATVGVDSCSSRHEQVFRLRHTAVRGQSQRTGNRTHINIKIDRVAVAQGDVIARDNLDVVEVVVHGIKGDIVRSPRLNDGLAGHLYAVNRLGYRTARLHGQVLRGCDLPEDDRVGIAQVNINTDTRPKVRSRNGSGEIVGGSDQRDGVGPNGNVRIPGHRQVLGLGQIPAGLDRQVTGHR